MYIFVDLVVDDDDNGCPSLQAEGQGGLGGIVCALEGGGVLTLKRWMGFASGLGLAGGRGEGGRGKCVVKGGGVFTVTGWEA